MPHIAINWDSVPFFASQIIFGCFSNGKTVNDLSFQNLISPCIVVDISQESHADYCVALKTIRNFENQYGKMWKNAFVIFYTGWDRFWTKPEKYHNDYKFPSISKEVAEYLVAENVTGIGVDTLSPDDQRVAIQCIKSF